MVDIVSYHTDPSVVAISHKRWDHSSHSGSIEGLFVSILMGVDMRICVCMWEINQGLSFSVGGGGVRESVAGRDAMHARARERERERSGW